MPEWNVISFTNYGREPVVVSIEPVGLCETLAPEATVMVRAAAVDGLEFVTEVWVNEDGGVCISAGLFSQGEEPKNYHAGPMHIQLPNSEWDLLDMPPSFPMPT